MATLVTLDESFNLLSLRLFMSKVDNDTKFPVVLNGLKKAFPGEGKHMVPGVQGPYRARELTLTMLLSLFHH